MIRPFPTVFLLAVGVGVPLATGATEAVLLHARSSEAARATPVLLTPSAAAATLVCQSRPHGPAQRR
jgi:hypothetical protein